MSIYKRIALIVGGAALVIMPLMSVAQTAPTGLLTVYMLVNNATGQSYVPANFTVALSGNSPSATSFQGSQSGTNISLNPGSYNVSVANQYGYTPSYSVGCNSTIAGGQTQTCVITMSYTGGSGTSATTVYPYPYVRQPLTCRTETPTVGLGQSARFVAAGGVGGTYNWFASGRNFPNIGPVLTTTFDGSGTQTVTVTNAAETVTCPITVTTTYYPQPVSTTYPTTPSYPNYYPTYPNYTIGTTYPSYPTNPSYTAYPGAYPGVYGYAPTPAPKVTSYVVPRWPNTGVEPLSALQVTYAVVLLMVASLVTYPYVRKAFALAIR
jgi:hypothetical protein